MMNMLHNPLFDYNAALSHFLEVRRQRQQHEYISNGGSIVGLCNSSHSGSDTGTVESLSPSPPATVNSNLHHHHHHSMIGTGKSFTIDAILGHRHASSTSPSSSSTTTTKKSSSSNLETVLDFSNSGTPSSNKRFLASSSDKSDDGSSNNTKSSSNGGKSKRVRTIFTPEQLERLETEFERQQYMVGSERLYLAHTLQLTEAQVKVWFQNRRIKWRKQHLEITQQRLALLKQHRQQRMLQQQQQQQQQMRLEQEEHHHNTRKSPSDDTTTDSSESLVVNDYHPHRHFQSRRSVI